MTMARRCRGKFRLAYTGANGARIRAARPAALTPYLARYRTDRDGRDAIFLHLHITEDRQVGSVAVHLQFRDTRLLMHERVAVPYGIELDGIEVKHDRSGGRLRR